jgi:dihydrofolate reductase
MGRKTFDSIGKTLEQRNNIIISTNTSLTIKDALRLYLSFKDALKLHVMSVKIYL